MPPGHVQLENVLFAPLNIKNEAVGLIGLANKPGGFTERDAHVAKAFGDLAAVALTYADNQDDLRKSEERFRDIAANIPGAVYQFLTLPNGDFTIPYMSESGQALFERPLSELTDPSLLFENIHPDDLAPFQQSIANAAQSMAQWTHEFRIVKPGGRVKWLRGLSNPRHLPDGGILWNGVLLDITERKHIEDHLKMALTEKETLLRELYHRTKNTLQVIRSMLLLQAARMPDNAQAQHLVQNTENRIMTISLVHQKLYQSQDLSRIKMSEYIPELAHLIVQSYRISSHKIAFVFDIKDLFLLLDTAIPCGLIINELLTNTVKYAFPDEQAGEMSIRLFRWRTTVRGSHCRKGRHRMERTIERNERRNIEFTHVHNRPSMESRQGGNRPGLCVLHRSPPP